MTFINASQDNYPQTTSASFYACLADHVIVGVAEPLDNTTAAVIPPT